MRFSKKCSEKLGMFLIMKCLLPEYLHLPPISGTSVVSSLCSGLAQWFVM